MRDFLRLGNSVEMKYIASDDIWYFSSDSDDSNYSTLYLTDGSEIPVFKQLGKVKDLIEKSGNKDFARVGRRYIINKTYLSRINVPKQEVELTVKHKEGFREGYSVGYATGYSDGQSGRYSSMVAETHSKEVVLNVSREAIKGLLKELK